MIFDITQLKKIRKSLDLTQNKLAKEANVSQSMIAKMESGKLDPTYSYIKKIEKTISDLTKTHESEAKDIMSPSLISITKKQNCKEVIKIFTKNDISQVPVINDKEIIGLITESNLLSLSKDEIEVKIAEEIMSEPPPVISKNAKLSLITQLLKYYPIIIVRSSAKVEGVITKSDILKHLNKKA